MSASWATSRDQGTAPARRAEAAITERGTAEGFDEFVHATGQQLHRAALLLCGGDHHLAEDLTQTTYTKVFVSWRRVSRAENPVAYARTVLTRTYLSQRRLRRSGERPTDAVPEQPVEVGDAARRLDLISALALLSAQDRAVLVLRYWLDLDVTHTAHALGVREATVRQRARRALVRLRAHVPDLDPDPDPSEHGLQPSRTSSTSSTIQEHR